MISGFTLLALFGAVVASYTDVKYGVIKNNLTLSLFVVGVLGHLIVEGGRIAIPLLSSTLLIFIIGYAFWFVGGWSAGDAKEFLFLAALLPVYPAELKSSFNPILGPYPFIMTLFINTFLVVFPFIFLWGLYTSFKKAKLKEFLEPLKKIEESGINAGVFVAAILLSKILNVGPVFAIPLIIFSYRLSNRIKISLSLIVGAWFIYYSGAVYFVIRYFSGVLVAIMLFRLFWNSMNVLRKEALQETVKIEELAEGMVLTEEIYIGNDKIENRARGLTKDEIDKLKESHKMEEIRIKKTAPFAPVILAGLLISLTVGDLVMVMSLG
jgi:preflagellin peptidase FlaK